MTSDVRIRRGARRGSFAVACEALEGRQLLAAVSVNAGQSIKTIDPRFSGTNLAWWQWEMNTSQMRQMVSAAGLKLLRMPGGSSTDDNWHFFNPPPYNGYQTAPIMANFISAVGADSMVTLNYGTASPQEAAAELAYFNAPVGSTVNIGIGQVWDTGTNSWVNKDFKTAGYWAGLRAAAPLAVNDGLNFLRQSRSAPYDFTYYEIGNEEYATWEIDHHSAGGVGGSSPTNYISFAKSFSDLAQQIDPGIKIGIDVSMPLQFNMPNLNWTRDLLVQSAAQGFTPGFLSDHVYIGGLSDQNLLLHSINDPNYKTDRNFNGSWPGRASYYRGLINTNLGTTAGAGVQLMLTEFNCDLGNKQPVNLVGGLWTADALAGLAQTEYTAAVQWDLTNAYEALGSPDSTHYGWRQGKDMGLISTGSGPAPSSGPYVPYPEYFAQQLFSKIDQAGGSVLPVTSNDPNLSVYAVKETDGHVRLLAINKSASATISGTFNFSGFTPSGAGTQWQYGIAEDNAQAATSDGHSSLTTTTLTLPVSGGSSVTQSFPAYSMTVIDLPPAPPPPPPTVTGVFVNSTGWTSTFRDALQASGVGDATLGYAIDPADQLNELPWTNLNKVSIRFNQNVNVAQANLAITGVTAASYGISAFAYDATTFTATWTLDTVGVANEKLLLNLSDVTDAVSGLALDGEWPGTAANAFPSGDGVAGGAFRFRLNVLPGDANRSGGSVLGSDVTLVRNAQNFSPGTTGYSVFFDVNGSGSILGSDVTLVRNRQGTSLPAGEPPMALSFVSASSPQLKRKSSAPMRATELEVLRKALSATI